MKKRAIRNEFPKVRPVTVKGKKFYLIDARKKGTNGTRHFRKDKDEAKKLAEELAADFGKLGHEGLDFPTELRVMALNCADKLTPFGKTLYQATEFYVVHLRKEAIRAASRPISEIYDLYLEARKNSKRRPIAFDTVKELEKMGRKIKAAFNETLIRRVEKADIEDYLDEQEISNQTRKNIISKWSAFFEWAIKQKHTDFNPCNGIEAFPITREIERYSAEEVHALLRLCETSHPDLLAYLCIGFFAGLRPGETRNLKWEDINTNGQVPQIKVIKTTYIIKDRTRYVTIEPNLVEWLKIPENKKGSIIPSNFQKRMSAFKIAAGFQLLGENPDAKRWIPDGLRHTYASFWRAKYSDDSRLAMQMGNSYEMIHLHYNQSVGNGEDVQFWNIYPAAIMKARDEWAAEQDRLADEMQPFFDNSTVAGVDFECL